MNIFVGIGRLTSDPKISNYTGNDGQAGTIARYTLAIDRPGRRDQNGQNADFINCVVFGKAAEFAQKYLSKGRKIGVVGRIQTGSYTNKDGQKVYTTDVYVSEQNFADGKPQEQQTPQNQGYQYQAPPQMAQPQMMQTPPQMAQASQGYVDPQNPYQNPTVQQMPPQMPGQQNYYQASQTPPQPQFNSNEGFMQIPTGADDTGLPFN